MNYEKYSSHLVTQETLQGLRRSILGTRDKDYLCFYTEARSLDSGTRNKQTKIPEIKIYNFTNWQSKINYP